MGRIVLAVCLSVGSLAAQKVLLADDRDRQVGVFAVRDLAGAAADAGDDAPAAVRFAGLHPAGAEDIASILGGAGRRSGDHVEAVGPGHIVALGEPTWIGSVESMLVHMRGAGQRQYQVDTRFGLVSEAVVAELDPGHVLENKHAAAGTNLKFVMKREAAMKLVRLIRDDKQSQLIQAPQVTVYELERLRVKVGKNVVVQHPGLGSDDQPAVPSTETIWSGHDATIVVATTSKGVFTVSVGVGSQEVRLPDSVPALDAGGGNSREVQLPGVRSWRTMASQEMVDGATLALAARGGDGTWMVTLLTLQEIWPAGVPAVRR